MFIGKSEHNVAINCTRDKGGIKEMEEISFKTNDEDAVAYTERPVIRHKPCAKTFVTSSHR